MKRTKPDYSIAKVWIICPDCGNNYPSRGDAPLCPDCGYDDWAEYRSVQTPAWLTGKIAEA